MRVWMKALALLAVVLVFAASFFLLGRVIGFASPWLVLLLMFYFLAIAKVAEPLFTLSMPSRLRPLRRWELQGRVYRRLGVLGFGKLLRDSPLRYLNAAVYLDRKRNDSARVLHLAGSGEASHFWAALLLLPYIARLAVRGEWDVVASFLLAELLVNVYPILHLRHTRGRLERMVRRIQLLRAEPARARSGG